MLRRVACAQALPVCASGSLPEASVANQALRANALQVVLWLLRW
jgi:hypothetical protein